MRRWIKSLNRAWITARDVAGTAAGSTKSRLRPEERVEHALFGRRIVRNPPAGENTPFRRQVAQSPAVNRAARDPVPTPLFTATDQNAECNGIHTPRAEAARAPPTSRIFVADRCCIRFGNHSVDASTGKRLKNTASAPCSGVSTEEAL